MILSRAKHLSGPAAVKLTTERGLFSRSAAAHKHDCNPRVFLQHDSRNVLPAKSEEKQSEATEGFTNLQFIPKDKVRLSHAQISR